MVHEIGVEAALAYLLGRKISRQLIENGGNHLHMREFTSPLKLYIKNHRLSAVVFSFHLNTDRPFGALGLRSPDEPPEPLPFEPPELFLASFAAAAAACAAEIVAEVPSP